MTSKWAVYMTMDGRISMAGLSGAWRGGHSAAWAAQGRSVEAPLPRRAWALHLRDSPCCCRLLPRCFCRRQVQVSGAGIAPPSALGGPALGCAGLPGHHQQAHALRAPWPRRYLAEAIKDSVASA